MRLRCSHPPTGAVERTGEDIVAMLRQVPGPDSPTRDQLYSTSGVVRIGAAGRERRELAEKENDRI
jgi:hypothetical protein